MRSALVRVAALVCTAVAVAGCTSSKSTSGGATDGRTVGVVSGSITVFAASSLTETFTALGKRFEAAHPGTTVEFNFGASSTLATQIGEGAPADVFAAASPKNMKAVTAAGNAVDPAVFVTNTMEIATPPGNPAHVTSIADLAKSSVKVALCDPIVPCGVVAQQVFTKAGVAVHPTSLEADVKSTLAKVELGEVDAGVVYVTDVLAAGSKVVGVPIPAGVNAATDYPIARLTHSANAALARFFVEYVQSPEALAVLTAAGFSGP